jgi:hypothetical protein
VGGQQHRHKSGRSGFSATGRFAADDADHITWSGYACTGSIANIERSGANNNAADHANPSGDRFFLGAALGAADF